MDITKETIEELAQHALDNEDCVLLYSLLELTLIEIFEGDTYE